MDLCRVCCSPILDGQCVIGVHPDLNESRFVNAKRIVRLFGPTEKPFIAVLLNEALPPDLWKRIPDKDNDIIYLETNPDSTAKTFIQELYTLERAFGAGGPHFWEKMEHSGPSPWKNVISVNLRVEMPGSYHKQFSEPAMLRIALVDYPLSDPFFENTQTMTSQAEYPISLLYPRVLNVASEIQETWEDIFTLPVQEARPAAPLSRKRWESYDSVSLEDFGKALAKTVQRPEQRKWLTRLWYEFQQSQDSEVFWKGILSAGVKPETIVEVLATLTAVKHVPHTTVRLPFKDVLFPPKPKPEPSVRPSPLPRPLRKETPLIELFPPPKNITYGQLKEIIEVWKQGATPLLVRDLEYYLLDLKFRDSAKINMGTWIQISDLLRTEWIDFVEAARDMGMQ